MRVGCYTLDLYCSIGYPECKEQGKVPSCGWQQHMHQFTGRTEAECLREAKAAGWYVGVRNKELCPRHYLLKQRKETWDSRMAYWNYKTGRAFIR